MGIAFAVPTTKQDKMTEQEYKEQRAYWLNAAKSLNKREYEEVRKEIYQEFILDRSINR